MRKIVYVLLLFLCHLQGMAQPGSLDATFNSTDVGYGKGDGPDPGTYTVAVQADGKILITSRFHFQTYDGSLLYGIVRLLPDGSRDPSFSPFQLSLSNGTPDGSINTIAIQADGKILIGGNFEKINGFTKNSLARLNPDGTLDQSFLASGVQRKLPTNSTMVPADVNKILIQPDGKILVGGSFEKCNGWTRDGIARLNADGSLDTGFGPNWTIGGVQLESVALQPDGKIIVVGFTGYTEQRVQLGVNRLNTNGTCDLTFNQAAQNQLTTPGASNGNLGYTIIHTVAVQSDGKILIGGEFITYNGVARNHIARLNADGTLDANFNPGTGTDKIVGSLLILPDGKILISGNFTTYNGVSKKYLARVASNGTLDATYNPASINEYEGVIPRYSSTLVSIFHYNDKILLIGSAATANGQYRNMLSMLKGDGTLDASFRQGFGFNLVPTSASYYFSTHHQADGKLIVVGPFYAYNGITRQEIARLNTDGSLDMSYDPVAMLPSRHPDVPISAPLLQADGKLLFQYMDKVNSQLKIVRFNSNGTIDSTFKLNGTGFGSSGRATCLLQQPDGKILVAGEYNAYNGASPGMVRLNSNGTPDASFSIGSGLNSVIQKMTLQPDGKILIAGMFTMVNGATRKDIARLNPDGSLDQGFYAGAGLNTYAIFNDIAVQANGKIVVGGSFNSINGVARNALARLNADGTLDGSFNSSGGLNLYAIVNALKLQSDGKILVGGSFADYNNTSLSGFLRLNIDGTLDTSFHTGAGLTQNIQGSTLSRSVHSISIQSDGKIIIAGNFTAYNGIGRNRIARINVSNVVTALPSVAWDRDITVGPNPVKSNLVMYNHSRPASFLVLLKNSGSVEVMNKRTWSGSTLTLNMGNYPAGLYIAEIINLRTGEKIQRKIVKL